MQAESGKWWAILNDVAQTMGECPTTFSGAIALRGGEVLGISASRGMKGQCEECGIIQTKQLVPGEGLGGKVWRDGSECANAICADVDLLKIGMTTLRTADLVYVIGQAGHGIKLLVCSGVTVLHREHATATTTRLEP